MLVLQVMTCSLLDEKSQLSLFFKCELFQKTGSFKFRVSAQQPAKATLQPSWTMHVHRVVFARLEHMYLSVL